MGYIEKFYPESRFGGYTDIDGTICFYTRVNSLLDSSFTIIDVGCGRGQYLNDPILSGNNSESLKGKFLKLSV